MAQPGASKVSHSEDIYEDGNGLILYQYYPSFYSQRVVFALHEKKLKFKSHQVDLFHGEQFEPSFLKLNPKAEVPVLKDGVKIIPDSSRIIDYLEDNFSNGDTPRLKPEKGSAAYQAMEKFNVLLDKISMFELKMGCFYHPQVTENMKMSPSEIKTTLSKIEGFSTQLTELAEKNKEFSDLYNAKKDVNQKRMATVKDVANIKKNLKIVDDVLDEIEKELASRDEDKAKWFLCGEKFTITDITLAIFLNRLQFLGLWIRYFGFSKRPKLAAYFKRVQRRDAYRRTIYAGSGILGSLCCLGSKEKLAVSLGGAMIVLGVAALATFLVQRRK